MKEYRINELITTRINGEWGEEPKPDSSLNTKVLRTTNFSNDGRIDFSNIVERFIQNKIVEEKKLLHGDVIIEKSGGSPTQPVGRVVYFDKYNFTAVCNNFTSVLRPDSKLVEPKFFFYALFYNHLTKRTLRFQNKTTGIINLKLENYLDDKIIIPESIETQRQIVSVLDKAQSIIDKRKVGLQLLDKLLKDTFLDMFLEYEAKNTVDLSEIASVTSGLTKGKNYFGKKTRFVPYMRVANVQDGYLDLNEIKEIEATPDEIESFNLQYEDLLLTEGGDPDKLGRGTVWKNQIPGCIFQNHIFRVRVNSKEKVNPLFLSFQTGSGYGKRYFLKSAKQTTGIASINSTQLKRFPVFLPPVHLQNKFVSIAEQSEALKVKFNQNLNVSENLFGSLLQKAFSEEGIEVEQKASDFEQTWQLLIWLQKQVQGLPGNTAREIFLNKLERQLVSLYEKPEKILVKDTVKDLLSLSSMLRQLFQDQNVSSAAAVTTRKQVDKLLPENFRKGNAQAGQFYKILYNYAGNEEKKIRKAEEAFRSDPRYRYILESKIGVTTIRGIEVDLLGIIYRRYKRSEFSIGNLEELLFDEKGFFENAGLLEEFFFQILDRFVCAEFWDQPFTFFQLRETLKSLLVEPDFPSLTSYVTSRLEQEPALLRQLFYDDKIKDQSPVAYNYFSDLLQQGFTLPRRLYLKYNNLKPAERI